MKGLKITLIAILSAIVVGLTAIMLAGASGHNFFGGEYLFDNYTLQNVRNVSIEDMGMMTVNMSNCGYSVNFLPIEGYAGSGETVGNTEALDGRSIIVEEYFNFEAESTDYADITMTDGVLDQARQKNGLDAELKISGKKRNGFAGRNRWGINSADGYLNIYLPQEFWQQAAALELNNTRGDLSFKYTLEELEGLMELRDFRAATNSGDITIPFVKAETAVLESSSGYQTVNGFVGDSLQMSASSGDIELGECKGSLKMGTSSGYQTVGSFEGDNIRMSASSGDITLRACRGNAFIETSSGNIQMGDCTGNAELKSSSGEQRVGTCLGNLIASSTSGDISIESCVGDVWLATSSGDSQVLGGQGGIVASSTSGLIRLVDYRLQKGADVEVSSGDITIELTEMSGNISLRGTSGNVDLILPEEAEFTFVAETTSGEILNYFEGNHELELTYNNRRNHAEGSTGADAEYRIQCSLSSGDVEIASR